jgi:hypothetical protein
VTVAGAIPPAAHVHWLFATGFLLLGLLLAAEGIVGPAVWAKRRWRVYLWPALLFAGGLAMFPVMVFFTNSTVHMLAHGTWAQVMLLAGAAHLGLAAGRLRNPLWQLTLPLAMAVSGAAMLVHEQNPWLFSRAAFLHHLGGWLLIGAALIPVLRTWRPASTPIGVAVGLAFVAFAVVLYADRDVAEIFGHISPLAGEPHR